MFINYYYYGNIMKYYELWIILWKWRKEFNVKEFTAAFESPSPNKVLFDMTKKGFLEKVERGKYRVVSPDQLFEKRVNISKFYDFLKELKLKYSLTGPDAVFLWTKGGYQVGRFFGFYPIHIKILRSDLKKWQKILKSKGIKYHIKNKPIKETLFGTFYLLEPEDKFESEKIDDLHVDSLDQTTEFCKKNIYQYEPALEMLKKTKENLTI